MKGDRAFLERTSDFRGAADLLDQASASALLGQEFFDTTQPETKLNRFVGSGYDLGSARRAGTASAMVAVSGPNNQVINIGSGNSRMVSNDGGFYFETTSITNFWGVSIEPRNGLHTGTQYVLVGDTGNVWIGPSGYSWTRLQPGGGTATLRGICIGGGGRIVVVGESGAIYSSDDGGFTWTAQTSGTTEILWAVVWTGTQYIVASNAGALTSPDGVAWTVQTISGASLSLTECVYANGVTVIAGSNGQLYTSTDGVTWTARAHASGTSNITELFYRAGRWVAATWGNSSTSTDGITWTATVGNLDQPYSIFWTGQELHSVGNTGQSGVSADGGLTWRKPNSFQVARALNGLFFMGSTEGVLWYGSDGVTWTRYYFPTSFILKDIAWSGSTYVVVGEAGSIWYSSDLVNWTQATSGVSVYLNGIVYAKGQFVVVGNSGTILTSPDGISWTSRTSGTGLSFAGIAYGDGTFVACGASNTLRRSTDCATWTGIPGSPETSPTRIAYGKHGWFVSFSSTGGLYKTSDFVTWTGFPEVDNSSYAVACDGSLVVVGSFGGYFYSYDGITFTKVNSHAMYGAAYMNGTVLLAGSVDGTNAHFCYTTRGIPKYDVWSDGYLKRWNGSAWVDAVLRQWNGSEWMQPLNNITDESGPSVLTENQEFILLE